MQLMETVPANAGEYLPFAVLWTRDDCEAFEKAGVLDYNYELINGVIIKKMGQNLRHAGTVTKAMSWLLGCFDSNRLVTQASVYVSSTETPSNKPEPDVSLLVRSVDDIETKQPRPEDMQFAIEVSDTTLALDLNTKAGLYARAGIPEYWVISVEERKIYVHTDPRNGTYSRREYTETDTVTLSFAPDVSVVVATLLPKPLP